MDYKQAFEIVLTLYILTVLILLAGALAICLYYKKCDGSRGRRGCFGFNNKYTIENNMRLAAADSMRATTKRGLLLDDPDPTSGRDGEPALSNLRRECSVSLPTIDIYHLRRLQRGGVHDDAT